MWPQLVYLGLMLLTAGLYLSRHGEPREDKYNFWALLMADALILFILYKGGFFEVFAR